MRFLIGEIIPVGFEPCGDLGLDIFFLVSRILLQITIDTINFCSQSCGLKKSCKPFVAQPVPDILNYGGNNEDSITD